MSGVIETVDLATGKPVGRRIIVPFVHWLEAFPETGEMVVSVGDNRAVVWRYFPLEKHFHATQGLYWLAEQVIKVVGSPLGF